jgi:TonB family protein
MNRFYTCLVVSIILHIAVLVPLQILAKHGSTAVASVIKVSLVDRPNNNQEAVLKEKPSEKRPEEKPDPVRNLDTPKSTHDKDDDTSEEEMSFTADAKVDPSYMGRLKAKIFSRWIYPQKAINANMQGTAIISFSVESSGRVSALRVVKSSNIKILDAAAINAVRDASPFPPPGSDAAPDISITGKFCYVID